MKTKEELAKEINELMIENCSSREGTHLNPAKAAVFADAMVLQMAFMIVLMNNVARTATRGELGNDNCLVNEVVEALRWEVEDMTKRAIIFERDRQKAAVN